MIQFYNDAYLPRMGAKHPAALGQRAEECWPEAWEIIGPQLQAVLDTGERTYRENIVIPISRNGRIQNADDSVGGGSHDQSQLADHISEWERPQSSRSKWRHRRPRFLGELSQRHLREFPFRKALQRGHALEHQR